jgi:macrodomain Ter protein organizer (MatP/YcbG family)
LSTEFIQAKIISAQFWSWTQPHMSSNLQQWDNMKLKITKKMFNPSPLKKHTNEALIACTYVTYQSLSDTVANPNHKTM